MKKNIRITGLIILPIIILIAVSCGTKTDKNEQLVKIDSLKMIIDRMELKLNEIDFGKANKALIEYRLNMNDIVAHIEKELDTVSGKYLMAYTEVKAPLKSFVKHQPQIKKDIAKARKQLDDLYHDVEKELINEDKFEAYLNAESDSIFILNNWVSENVDKVKEQILNFDSLNPRIKDIIQFHKNK